MFTYYVVKLLTNDKGQDGSSITVHTGNTDDEARTKAFVEYHSTLRNYHNAADVLYAVVEVQNSEGTVISPEIVDHRPKDELPVIAEG